VTGARLSEKKEKKKKKKKKKKNSNPSIQQSRFLTARLGLFNPGH
jgi:hypothetical protein